MLLVLKREDGSHVAQLEAPVVPRVGDGIQIQATQNGVETTYGYTVRSVDYYFKQRTDKLDLVLLKVQ